MAKKILNARIDEIQDKYLVEKAKQKRTTKSNILRDCIDSNIQDDYGSFEYFTKLFNLNPKKS
jgi:hypothetical protein